MSKTDGGPAFPTLACRSDMPASYTDCPGMTLRDYFAAKALQGLLAKEGCAADGITQTLAGSDPQRDALLFAHGDAQRAYVYADAMLAARKLKL